MAMHTNDALAFVHKADGSYRRARSPLPTVSGIQGTGTDPRSSRDVVPEALIVSLFEPMVRGVSGDSGTRSVGLGLYIVNVIASAQGGEVTVTSSREKGTSFVFSFPRT